MTQFWTMGPTAAALGLRAMGFAPQEAERLVTLKLRYERGEFRDLTDEQQRLRFGRWLVERHRICDCCDRRAIAVRGEK